MDLWAMGPDTLCTLCISKNSSSKPSSTNRRSAVSRPPLASSSIACDPDMKYPPSDSTAFAATAMPSACGRSSAPS